MINILKQFNAPELRKANVIAWSIATITTIFVMVSIGNIYASEAKNLLESIQKSSLYYASAVAASSSTVLALTLTILSLSANRKEPKKETFLRLHSIANYCVVGFVGAIVLLFVISFPVLELEQIPNHWFRYIYYTVCIWNGILAGFMIATILILKDTTVALIGGLSPDFDDEGKEKDS